MNDLNQRLPKIAGSRGFILNKVRHSETLYPEVPEEIMAFAEQVMGNAQARVAMTTDFGMKDFGNGPNGSCTISLACNQDDETINTVRQALSQWTIFYAKEHFEAANVEFQQMVTKTKGGPPNFKP